MKIYNKLCSEYDKITIKISEAKDSEQIILDKLEKLVLRKEKLEDMITIANDLKL